MYKRVVAAILLGACLLWAGCSDSGGSGSSAPPRRPPPSSSRPPSGSATASRGRGGASMFRLPMPDGTPVTVKTPAALFFFTSWCGYCKQAMPEINQLSMRARQQGWRVYGIEVNEGPAQANGFIQQYRPNFPILLDQEGSVARQYGIKGYPTFILIDENANIIYNAHEVPRRF